MIKENLEKIRATVPEGVTLVAVSKTKPILNESSVLYCTVLTVLKLFLLVSGLG